MALYHFEWVFIQNPKYFINLYILVEFFFVISGFFIVINSSKKTLSSYKYVLNQLLKIYPIYLMAFCFCFIIYLIQNNIAFSYVPLLLWNAKWEILMCNLFVLSNNTIYNNGGAPAFIPALLFATLVLHYLYNNHKKISINIIIPFIIVCGIGRIFYVAGNISQWLKFDNVIALGIIRAFVDISIGILFADKVYPYLKEKNKFLNIFLLIFSILSFPLLILFRNNIDSFDLILWIFIFGLFITEATILFNNRFSKINKILVSFGKLSFPIFMFHYGVIQLLIYMNLKIKLPYIVIIYLIFIIIISIFSLIINNLFFKKKNL